MYKTPLLPTRLRGSSTVPDMFKPRRMHAPVLMHDRDRKPRLGMAEKAGEVEKAPEESQRVKPYAGSGGMRKLLARRRKEEQEEERKNGDEQEVQEQAQAIVTDEESNLRQNAQEVDAKLAVELNPANPARELERPEPEPAVTSIGGREQPSLRIGRTRTSRSHIVRPKLKPRAGRFSALYEEDEDDAMEEGGQKEAKLTEKAAASQIPPGFSFAKVCLVYCIDRHLLIQIFCGSPSRRPDLFGLTL